MTGLMTYIGKKAKDKLTGNVFVIDRQVWCDIFGCICLAGVETGNNFISVRDLEILDNEENS